MLRIGWGDMRLPPNRPLSIRCGDAIIRAASLLVPQDGEPLSRQEWLTDWQGRIKSRWDFLRETGLWDRREATELVAYCLLAFVDAAYQIFRQDPFRGRVRRAIQSPLSVIVVLLVVLSTIAVASGGLPATRDLIFKNYDHGGSRLAFAWLHIVRHRGETPLPADIVPAWNKHGTVVESAAAFRASRLPVTPPHEPPTKALVIKTQPGFFQVFGIAPAIGTVQEAKTVVLSYNAWTRLFSSDPHVLGSIVNVDGENFAVSAVLPPRVDPLTRQPALYLLIPNFNHGDVFAALRVKGGTSASQLNRELLKVAEDYTFSYLQGQLRFTFARPAELTPVWSFLGAAFSSALLLMIAFRLKLSAFRESLNKEHRKLFARQALFMSTKTMLALACVFTACLEWSRSESAILFGTYDPASGPFLLWLYIAGSMGVFFWSVLDQRARCRECLRLLVFPVRIGSPGNMLLDWSGTEFCCSEGHGVLHVPHLAPSWSEESDRWISMDDSWQSLFHDKHENSKSQGS